MAPIMTSVIGSMPKPAYLNIPAWIQDGKPVENFVEKFNLAKKENNKDNENEILRATQEIINLQERAGIDVVTDGELRRDNYIYGFCRRLNGFDFEELQKKVCRNGAWEGTLPRITSEVSLKEEESESLVNEWRWAQNLSRTPVKVTIPGPLTIMDTTCNGFYKDEEVLGQALVKCINTTVKKLAAAGCKQIQIDEPVLVRHPDKALKFAIKLLSECFNGVPQGTFKTVHACCGYPDYLDQTDYRKADKDAYSQLASALDDANFDAISIEDTHRRNDVQLFSKFKKMKVVLGVVDVVKSRVETVDEIRDHILDVLQYIPAERLIVAPDCGMLFLPMELAEQKLSNMVKAAGSIELQSCCK